MIKYLLWLVITWMALKRNAVNGPVLLIFNFLWNRFISGCNFSFWWKHFHNSAFWVIQHFSKCPLSHWAWVKLNLWETPCKNRKISESKPFKCSCHSYPSEELSLSREYFCLQMCSNQGHSSWYKITGMAVLLCSAALIMLEIGTWLVHIVWTFPASEKKGATKIITIKTSRWSLWFCYC